MGEGEWGGPGLSTLWAWVLVGVSQCQTERALFFQCLNYSPRMQVSREPLNPLRAESVRGPPALSTYLAISGWAQGAGEGQDSWLGHCSLHSQPSPRAIASPLQLVQEPSKDSS